MELSNLRTPFDEARKLSGHAEYVVVGSLSALGIVRAGPVPPRMLLSIDVDCFTRQDPGRIFELREALGEGSAFEAARGFYLDPISPNLPTLPAQWESRLVRVSLKHDLTVCFLDPNDAAVSKYSRGEPRDREWLQAGLAAGLLSAPTIESRFRDTVFLDDDERRRALDAFALDRARRAKPDASPRGK